MKSQKEKLVLLCRAAEAFSATWFLRKGVKMSSQSACFYNNKEALFFCLRARSVFLATSETFQGILMFPKQSRRRWESRFYGSFARLTSITPLGIASRHPPASGDGEGQKGSWVVAAVSQESCVELVELC